MNNSLINWFKSLRGAMMLSTATLISEVWRIFLDAMFIFPTDIGDPNLMHLGALIATLLFSGWTWSLIVAAQGRRGGLIAAFAINLIVLFIIPVSWLFFYCPVDCQAQAGLFNLANTLNLIFGLLAAISLGLQFRKSAQVSLAK
jgi:hypothetical protein